MGTQELDWLAVANNLLSKCHINLQIADLTQCDAHVFLALYEAILGEKVPDFITPPRSQEDDAHNVQSVIDSLALDYLQVSLSHITGENIVRGDIESIRNLLEIFDGLLEYLTEQISEASSQNGDEADSRIPRDQYNGQKNDLPALRPPPSLGSSEAVTPSWEPDGSESTNELIRLGDTAYTFVHRGLNTERPQQKKVQTGIPGTDVSTGTSPSVLLAPPRVPTPKEPESTLHGDLPMNGFSLPSAIPLRPPFQPKDSRPATVGHDKVTSSSSIPLRPPFQPNDSRPMTVSPDIQVSESSAGAAGSPARSGKSLTTAKESAETSRTVTEDVPPVRSPDSSHPKSPERRSPKHTDRVSSPEVAQKKVAFRTLPDIRFMTLQRTLEETSERPAPSDGGESDPVLDSGFSLLDSRTSDLCLADEPLSVQRARNKLSEMELQEMSDKLSRRLDQLDKMLKKALGERSQVSELKDEDKLSQHSDSIMEFRRKKRLQDARSHKKPPSRPRSLSSSPVPRPLPCAQFEDALNKEAKGDLGKIRKELQKELDLQRLKAQMLNDAYREELRDMEKTEKGKLSKMKENVKLKDQEYKDKFVTEPEKKSHPERVYSEGPSRAAPAVRHWSPRGHVTAPRMQIQDNDLLPLLLEEFPHLQISPHTFNAMWKEQLAQTEQLARSGQDDERSERKLQRELEEAHKRHDLLTDIIRREQGQNQRLKDFKERIRLQKMAQNKTRENRQQATRARKYYEDYHVQLRAKLMRKRTREERIIKKLFQEGLQIQKQRLQEVRSYAKEQRNQQRRRHKDELESMENYYKDQFSMLAEAVAQEKQEIRAQEKAQVKDLHKAKKDLRARMEGEIRALQEMIVRADEDAFFRELEAERLKRRLNMASFQYGKSHCL